MKGLCVSVAKLPFKNPLIAGSAEHLIEADNVRRALRSGAGAVVVKSANETVRGRQQLQRAEYMLLDENWREIAWAPSAPATAFVACRSGLTPQSFDAWLEQTALLDREARDADAYVVASLIVADTGRASVFPISPKRLSMRAAMPS
jgi:dihydroorotate dehydrogenase (NAD+) catalytic subunit